jgi:hypothetical protein
MSDLKVGDRVRVTMPGSFEAIGSVVETDYGGVLERTMVRVAFDEDLFPSVTESGRRTRWVRGDYCALIQEDNR